MWPCIVLRQQSDPSGTRMVILLPLTETFFSGLLYLKQYRKFTSARRVSVSVNQNRNRLGHPIDRNATYQPLSGFCHSLILLIDEMVTRCFCEHYCLLAGRCSFKLSRSCLFLFILGHFLLRIDDRFCGHGHWSCVGVVCILWKRIAFDLGKIPCVFELQRYFGREDG